LGLLTGCELSQTPGVSIRPPFYQGGGQWGAEESWHLQDSLSSLAARTLSPEAVWELGRVISTVDASASYEIVLSVPRQERGSKLAEAIRGTFGIQAVRATRQIPVKVLVRSGQPLKLTPTTQPSSPKADTRPVWVCGDLGNLFRPYEPTVHTFSGFTMKDLAAWLEYRGSKVVLNETGLNGAYDFTLVEDGRKHITLDDSLHALGLTLEPGVRSADAVFVEPTPVPGAIRLRVLAPAYQKDGPDWWATRK
jgi:hypothetical protein